MPNKRPSKAATVKKASNKSSSNKRPSKATTAKKPSNKKLSNKQPSKAATAKKSSNKDGGQASTKTPQITKYFSTLKSQAETSKKRHRDDDETTDDEEKMTFGLLPHSPGVKPENNDNSAVASSLSGRQKKPRMSDDETTDDDMEMTHGLRPRSPGINPKNSDNSTVASSLPEDRKNRPPPHRTRVNSGDSDNEYAPVTDPEDDASKDPEYTSSLLEGPMNRRLSVTSGDDDVEDDGIPYMLSQNVDMEVMQASTGDLDLDPQESDNDDDYDDEASASVGSENDGGRSVILSKDILDKATASLTTLCEFAASLACDSMYVVDPILKKMLADKSMPRKLLATKLMPRLLVAKLAEGPQCLLDMDLWKALPTTNTADKRVGVYGFLMETGGMYVGKALVYRKARKLNRSGIGSRIGDHLNPRIRQHQPSKLLYLNHIWGGGPLRIVQLAAGRPAKWSNDDEKAALSLLEGLLTISCGTYGGRNGEYARLIDRFGFRFNDCSLASLTGFESTASTKLHRLALAQFRRDFKGLLRIRNQALFEQLTSKSGVSGFGGMYKFWDENPGFLIESAENMNKIRKARIAAEGFTESEKQNQQNFGKVAQENISRQYEKTGRLLKSIHGIKFNCPKRGSKRTLGCEMWLPKTTHGKKNCQMRALRGSSGEWQIHAKGPKGPWKLIDMKRSTADGLDKIGTEPGWESFFQWLKKLEESNEASPGSEVTDEYLLSRYAITREQLAFLKSLKSTTHRPQASRSIFTLEMDIFITAKIIIGGLYPLQFESEWKQAALEHRKTTSIKSRSHVLRKHFKTNGSGLIPDQDVTDGKEPVEEADWMLL